MATIEEEMADVVVEAIERVTTPLVERIADLEKWIADVRAEKQQLADRHKGVWVHGTTYSRGDFALSGGSTFICLEDGCMGVMPGTNGEKWRLFAQRGRPGRDGGER